MLWLFQRKPQKATSFADPPPAGYLAAQPASELLQPAHRRQLLERIWQYTSISHPLFEQLYLGPIQRYAELVQQLPASEAHHHAYSGGLLDHGLELVACILKLRQSHLLPSGAAPEDQASQSDAWSAGLAYGALLHDVGKIAVDIEVEQQDGSAWHPWHGPLQQAYRFSYRRPRDYQLHSAASGLLLRQVLDSASLDWLSGFPALWSSLLYALSGQYERAGALGELIIQADRVSTAQNIGGNPQKALQAPTHSLQHHLITGLRHLLLQELKLNQPGAAGWLTQDALWLVSKTVTDKLRAWLLAQSIDGIPTSNSAMFDELQAHGLVEATPEGKAIWSATIEDGTWHQPFTLLKVPPALIWQKEERPAMFTGRVRVEATEDNPDTAESPFVRPLPSSTPPTPSDALDELLSLLDTASDAEQAPATEEAQVPLAPPARSDQGLEFLDWLKAGIAGHALIINDSGAKVHTVAGMAFLVTPGIFQRYCQEHPELSTQDGKAEPWRRVQRRFEALQLHRKRPDGLNIWECEVQGPRRKASRLKGYLLESTGTIFQAVPMDNPFLRLVDTQREA